MSEWSAFRDALRFLTRLPVPSADHLADDWLARAAKYFPAVGLLVGLASALVLLVASRIWLGLVPAILAVAASVALTGAFHEDGLGDTFDGLGGGSTIARRLEIMKDSRIGTYGALALVFGTLLRIAPLALLSPPLAACALLAAHACGRGAGVVVMNAVPHAGDPSVTKVMYGRGAIAPAEIAVAIFICGVSLVPIVMLVPKAAAVGVVAGAVLAAVVVRQARRLIGGSTGDILGAVEQAFEIGFLLGVAAVR